MATAYSISSPAPPFTSGPHWHRHGRGDARQRRSGLSRRRQIWSTSANEFCRFGGFRWRRETRFRRDKSESRQRQRFRTAWQGRWNISIGCAYAVGTTPETVAVGDLNGDGKPDLIVGNRNSANMSVFLGVGDGTFQAAVDYNTPTSGTPDSIAVGDFDGDGKPDLAVAISGINASEDRHLARQR